MFQKATKEQSKLRLAIFGVAGSGKTLSALRIAKGIAGENGTIALIDSEAGSSNKYGLGGNGKWQFDFDVCKLDKLSIDDYIKAINNAKEYDVLVIDSLSHAWQKLLQEVEQIAQSKFRGNSWSAWSQGTPRQKGLINAITWFPGHIIVTMRQKTEWMTVINEKGRAAPRREGLAPEQGKGIEYEFDLLMSLSDKHCAEIIKDRTGKYQDKIIQEPDELFGTELKDWLGEGLNPKEILKIYLDKIMLAQTLEELVILYKLTINNITIANDAELVEQLKEAAKQRKIALNCFNF